MKTLKALFRFLKPYTALYLTGLVGMGILQFALNAGIAFVLGELTTGLVDMNRNLLLQGVAAICAIVMVGSVFMWFAGLALAKSLASVERDMRHTFFSRLLNMSLAAKQKYSTGDLLSRFNSDLSESVLLFENTFNSMATMLFLGVGSCITIFVLDFRIGLLVLGMSLGLFLLNLPVIRKLSKAGEEVQGKKAGFLNVYTQLLGGQRLIRYFNLAGWINERILCRNETLKRAELRKGVLDVGRETLSEITQWTLLLVLVVGGFRAVNDADYRSKLIVILQLQSGVVHLFIAIAAACAEVGKRFAAVKRLMEIVDIAEEPEKLAPVQGATDLAAECHAGLSVRGLSFGYPDDGKPVLRNISFDVMPGKSAAFVGPSGCGKTILFKLLLGLFPPGEGNLQFAGKSIYDIPLKQWRAYFAYVPQNPFLFSGAIRDNLLAVLGDSPEDTADRRMEDAARHAHAHDFIMRLEAGYDAMIEEGAGNFSGGERQRMAIARALLRDAPVLLLDEATSALDAESEKIVQAAIPDLMRSRTTLVIAHRLSTVRQADCIYYVENGCIIEQGDHEALMAGADGKYRALVMAGGLCDDA